MAARPWVTPEEVRQYSDLPEVQARSDAKLRVDISRAEQTVISRTKNHFNDYETVPEPVKTAVILIAEYYADRAKSGVGSYKSENFDDYGYTLSDSGPGLTWSEIDPLLEEFILTEGNNPVTMKLRKL